MCFVLIKLLPITINVGIGKDRELLEAQIEARGWYKPIPEQFILYLKRIFLHGDFGIGTNMPEFANKPVWDTFVSMLPPTILLNVYSSLFSVPIGIALGIFAALKKNKWQDHTISTLVMVLISVPGYVTAFLLQYVICFKLGWFPLTANSGTDYFSWDMFVSLVPAVLAMSFGSIASYCRFTRAELTEVLTGDYLLLARTKGLTKRQSIFRHALRNAMVPIFPMIIGEFISVLSGSLIIENSLLRYSS
jgi:oligopeptide transport system permease protein